MAKTSGGKCFKCETPIVYLSWINGRVHIVVECPSCGEDTCFPLDESLKYLGKDDSEEPVPFEDMEPINNFKH